MIECLQPRKRTPVEVALQGRFCVCRTRLIQGEAVVSWEEASTCTGRTPRGRGPSTHARIAEIMPGRAISRQGLATTCKDPLTEALTVGGGRDLVWRMSPYER